MKAPNAGHWSPNRNAQSLGGFYPIEVFPPPWQHSPACSQLYELNQPLQMNLKIHESGKPLSQDLKNFEEPPAISYALILLHEESERSACILRADVNSQIEPQFDIAQQ